jgi:hypothetical protein
MNDFDIRQAVRSVIEETDLTEPSEIAAKVAESVPPKQLRSALADILRPFIVSELGRLQLASATAIRHVPSAKRAAIVELGQRWLRQRVAVDQTWKMVGDCTRDDCLTLAAERRRHAEQNAAAAATWEARAALLARHDAARLADLPADVLTEAEGRVAA